MTIRIDTTASRPVSESSEDPSYPSESCDGCWVVSYFSCRPVQIDVEFPDRKSYSFLHYERFRLSPTDFRLDVRTSLNASEWVTFSRASDGLIQGSVNLLNHFDLAHVHSSDVATFTVVRDDMTTIVEGDQEQVVDFALHEVYPNPLNSTTLLRFDLPLGQPSELAIYSVSGQKVATVVTGVLSAGRHLARWHGRSASGHRVASGVYLARLHSGSWVATRKALLLR